MNCPLCNSAVPNYLITNSKFYADYLKLEGKLEGLFQQYGVKNLDELIQCLQKPKADEPKADSSDNLKGRKK